MSDCTKGSAVADRLVAACPHVSARFREGHDWACASCIAAVIDALIGKEWPTTEAAVAGAEVVYGVNGEHERAAPAQTPPCGGSRCYLSEDGTQTQHSSKSYGTCSVRNELAAAREKPPPPQGACAECRGVCKDVSEHAWDPKDAHPIQVHCVGFRVTEPCAAHQPCPDGKKPRSDTEMPIKELLVEGRKQCCEFHRSGGKRSLWCGDAAI